MAPIDFTNDQNTMRGVILGYIYTLNIKCASRITLETLLCSLSYEIPLRNLVGRGLHLSRKECKCLANDENY